MTVTLYHTLHHRSVSLQWVLLCDGHTVPHSPSSLSILTVSTALWRSHCTTLSIIAQYPYSEYCFVTVRLYHTLHHRSVSLQWVLLCDGQTVPHSPSSLSILTVSTALWRSHCTTLSIIAQYPYSEYCSVTVTLYHTLHHRSVSLQWVLLCDGQTVPYSPSSLSILTVSTALWRSDCTTLSIIAQYPYSEYCSVTVTLYHTLHHRSVSLQWVLLCDGQTVPYSPSSLSILTVSTALWLLHCTTLSIIAQYPYSEYCFVMVTLYHTLRHHSVSLQYCFVTVTLYHTLHHCSVSLQWVLLCDGHTVPHSPSSLSILTVSTALWRSHLVYCFMCTGMPVTFIFSTVHFCLCNPHSQYAHLVFTLAISRTVIAATFKSKPIKQRQNLISRTLVVLSLKSLQINQETKLN